MSISPRWPQSAVRGLFSFRSGGVSLASYRSLNLGYHVADDPRHVTMNRERALERLGTTIQSLVCAEQVHGAGVAVVGEADRGRGALPDTPPVPGVDALVTASPGVTLMVMAADCVPILFYDAKNRVIAAAHSGWKGTTQHISVRVLETMSKAFGTDPADVEVSLGPSIRQCCYEVNHVVAEPVQQAFGRKVLLPRPYVQGKYLLSLQACIQADLRLAGVPVRQIHDVGVCTACRTHQLFSHRNEGGLTGRLAGLIQLV